MTLKLSLFLALVCCFSLTARAQFNANCFGSRTALVHLFEWRWDDIAKECERYLAPKGFCGVQVSPPNEYRVVTSPMRPWWERYQPVSYKTYSRSGDETAFIDMVTRCNNVGVRIYVDALLNHMAGSDATASVGVGGTAYDASKMDFPGVPYTSEHFNKKGADCTSGSGNIESWTDHSQVRNCQLVGLTDLKQSLPHVQTKLKEWLNRLISFGVAGFRFDAAKHMWPGDIKSIVDSLDNLPTKWFSAGSRAFVYQEVIDLEQNGEVKSSEYFGNGRVTEFNYGRYLSEYFEGRNGLSNLRYFGYGYAYLMPEDKALVFIDNHDNQRGHGGGGNILTLYKPREYTMAICYMLAWPYGQARVMSSYYWTTDWQGPPSDENYNISPVTINSDGSCGGGWACEHRWTAIGNMAQFRNLAGTAAVENWWSDGWNQIAFSRGNRAFIAINGDGGKTLSATLQTGLKGGTYCDIISGQKSNDGWSCTGKSVTVGSDGRASISLSGSGNSPILAIHLDSLLNGESGGNTGGEGGEGSASTISQVTPSPLPPVEGYARTVIFIYFQSQVGQNLFVRGGISTSRRPACEISQSACTIPIRYDHVTYSSSHYAGYNAWSKGDNYLDWNGAESGQGSYSGQAAQGSPMVWTTNSASDAAYNQLNSMGQHYWMLDVSMDCSATEGGWFELKSILNNGWESDITQSTTCSGSASQSRPYSSNNHMALCGYKNVFKYGEASCQIDKI